MEQKQINEVRAQVNKIREERRAFNAALNNIDMLADFVQEAIKGLPELEARKVEGERYITDLKAQEARLKESIKTHQPRMRELKEEFRVANDRLIDGIAGLKKEFAGLEQKLATAKKEWKEFREKVTVD